MNVITVGSELGCFLSVLVYVLFELLVVCKEKSTVSIDFFLLLDYNIESMCLQPEPMSGIKARMER